MTTINFSSSDWNLIRAWVEQQLKEARVKNDACSLDEIGTANLRGEIRVLKRFLGLPDQAKREATPPATFDYDE